MSADPRTEAIARARGPHLFAMRHTPSGATAWAAWRLEVAGILHEAAQQHEAATAGGESVVHVVAVVDALAEVGELAAADYVREVFDVGARLHHAGDLVLDEATETLQAAPSVPVQPAGRRTHRVGTEHPNVLTGPWGRS